MTSYGLLLSILAGYVSCGRVDVRKVGSSHIQNHAKQAHPNTERKAKVTVFHCNPFV